MACDHRRRGPFAGTDQSPPSNLDHWGQSCQLACQFPVRRKSGPTNAARIPGDANGDGRFNSTDLVLVFQAGEYEDGIAQNSTYAEGDWNGDGDFDTSDLILAFQAGYYVYEAVMAASVLLAVNNRVW